MKKNKREIMKNEFGKVEVSALIEAMEEKTEAINRNTSQRELANTIYTMFLVLMIIALTLTQARFEEKKNRYLKMESGTIYEIRLKEKTKDD